jgi:hypothetical protein
MNMPMPEQARKTATSHDIRDIIGHADDELVTEIMRTGASRSEILQAREWLDADDYMGEREEPMDARARRVYEILQEYRERLDEGRQIIDSIR